jgi:hypothetical protein
MIHEFYLKNILHLKDYNGAKNHKNHIIVAELLFEETEDIIIRKRTYRYNDNVLSWLKYFVSADFYYGVLNFCSTLTISKESNTMNVKVHDIEDKYYSFFAQIRFETLESNGTKVTIEIEKFQLKYDSMLPNWVKNKMIQHIIHQLEEDIKMYDSLYN